MKQKNIIKAIVLLVLLGMSSYGQYMEVLLNSYSDVFGVVVSELPNIGISYVDILSEAALYAVIEVGISAVIMMLVPCIVRIRNKEQLPYVYGKRLCMWNSIVLFVVSFVLNSMGWAFIGGIGAIAFYFINKWIFVDC